MTDFAMPLSMLLQLTARKHRHCCSGRNQRRNRMKIGELALPIASGPKLQMLKAGKLFRSKGREIISSRQILDGASVLIK
jgi:hypothetical protein